MIGEDAGALLMELGRQVSMLNWKRLMCLETDGRVIGNVGHLTSNDNLLNFRNDRRGFFSRILS